MRLKVKRAYDLPEESDGTRILVDRLWPRGLSKEQAHIDFWAKELSPSADLRRWYAHDPKKWPEFNQRYFAELDANRPGVAELLSFLENGPATLIFSSKELHLNNAVALKTYLQKLK